MGRHLTIEEKAELFDLIFEHRLEDLVQTDNQMKDAVAFKTGGNHWVPNQDGSFQYDEIIKEYFVERSTDPDFERVAGQMCGSYAISRVQRWGRHEVYFTARGDNGKLRLKHCLFFPAKDGHFWILIYDVTKNYKELSERLNNLRRSVKETERENKERNAFFNLLGQDAREPLYSMMGITRIKEDDSLDRAIIESYLGKISMSGNYINETIESVTELRSIAEGKATAKPIKINLGRFFEGIRPLILPEIEDRHLHYMEKLPESWDYRVLADANYLQKMVLRAIRIMAQNTVRGGRIIFEVRELYRGEDHVILDFSIECMGILLNADYLKVLFLPDLEAENELNVTDMEVIVLRSIARMNGAESVIVMMDESKGNRFTVRVSLPLWKASDR
ncbi:MAG: hypothetical protein K5989_11200 [Lachnospiraceae bacterium]|nr:hypothetical protein [Lachnospiraceae bacterium]